MHHFFQHPVKFYDIIFSNVHTFFQRNILVKSIVVSGFANITFSVFLRPKFHLPGDSGGEHTQNVDKEFTDQEDSDREIKSNSRGPGAGDHHIKESDADDDEGKPDIYDEEENADADDDDKEKPEVDDEEEKRDVDAHVEDVESFDQHADNPREKTDEDGEADESSSRENIGDDDSDSGKNEETRFKQQSSPGEEEKGEVDELSDDEPLVSHI